MNTLTTTTAVDDSAWDVVSGDVHSVCSALRALLTWAEAVSSDPSSERAEALAETVTAIASRSIDILHGLEDALCAITAPAASEGAEGGDA